LGKSEGCGNLKSGRTHHRNNPHFHVLAPQTLPKHRHPALLDQLSLLDREIKRRFSYPEELALAGVADSQGLGGHSGLLRSQPTG
jgi:hypothetical protein